MAKPRQELQNMVNLKKKIFKLRQFETNRKSVRLYGDGNFKSGLKKLDKISKRHALGTV